MISRCLQLCERNFIYVVNTLISDATNFCLMRYRSDFCSKQTGLRESPSIFNCSTKWIYGRTAAAWRTCACTTTLRVELPKSNHAPTTAQQLSRWISLRPTRQSISTVRLLWWTVSADGCVIWEFSLIYRRLRPLSAFCSSANTPRSLGGKWVKVNSSGTKLCRTSWKRLLLAISVGRGNGVGNKVCLRAAFSQVLLRSEIVWIAKWPW